MVLDTLSPAERLSFVLHDVFAVPFDDIAQITVASPVIVDRATALPAFPRYERLALRAIRINEFVWLHDAPASPQSGLTSPPQ